MPASRSQLSPDVYIKEAPLRECSDFMLFSHPHHLWGVDWYVGVRRFFAAVWPMVSALNRWQVGSQQNIGCFSPNPFYVRWLAWFQVRLHPSPLKYFREPVFASFATAVRQRGQKTPESIKFLLKVTQIILDVWRPNSNKPQSHQFV